MSLSISRVCTHPLRGAAVGQQPPAALVLAVFQCGGHPLPGATEPDPEHTVPL